MFTISKTYKKHGVLILVVLILIAVFSYGFFVEPKSQTIKYDTIRIDNLPSAWENAKIAFFSDTNFGDSYPIDTLKKTVKRINDTKPDLIIFGGHFFDGANGKNMISADIEKELLTLQAPLGKYAILSTPKSPSTTKDPAREALEAANFQILTNEQRPLYRYSLDPLNLIALNNNISPQDKTSILAENPDTPALLLDENTSGFDAIDKQQNIQLMLSFGTYGGFIGLPYINRQFAQTSYPSGLYRHNKQTLLVSNGIGTPKNARFRLLNYPTLYVITLQARR